MERQKSIRFVYVNKGESIKGKLLASDYPNIIFIDRGTLAESVNDASFNDSKFYGRICFLLAIGYDVFVDDGLSMVSKKGGLALNFHLNKRIPFVTTKVVDFTSEDVLQKGVYELDVDSANKLSLTFGFEATFVLDKENGDKGIVDKGHVTRDFAKSYKDYLDFLEREGNQQNFKQFEGTLVKFTCEGKVGHVISIPALDTDEKHNSHITVRSCLKAVLSGPIVGMFDNDIYSFKLSEIDKTVLDKVPVKDPLITISNYKAVDVEVTGPYVYALEVANQK